MRHDIAIAGHGFGLRPIAEADAGFAARLRADPALNRFIHAGDGDVEAQRRWLRAYEERPGDYYFIVEALARGEPEGLISVYDVADDPSAADAHCAEWGRWLLRPGSLAAVESAWLVYRVAFDRLGLPAVCCRTLSANTRVVSFHDSCGIDTRRLLPAHVPWPGGALDAVEHRVDRADWPRLSARLEPLARRTALRLGRG